MKEVLAVPAKSSSEIKECDISKIKELLQKLVSVMEEMDIDAADEIIASLSSEGIENVDESSFEILKQAVMNIDLEKIGEVVDILNEKLSK